MRMKKRMLLMTVLCIAVAQAWGQEVVDSGTCGTRTHIAWTYTDDGTLTISGEGDMLDFPPNGTPWHDYREQIKTVILEEGVTLIGRYAFENCINMDSIMLPDGMFVIQDRAFHNCSALTTLTIPVSMRGISAAAFEGCTSLTTLNYYAMECSVNASSYSK